MGERQRRALLRSGGAEEEESAAWERIEFVIENVLERDGLVACFEGVEVVYHLAAVAQVMAAARDPEYTFSVNVLGTMRIAELAGRAGAARFVFASSRDVYGDPLALPVSEDAPLNPKNVYGASKLAAEAFLRMTVHPPRSPVPCPRSSSHGPSSTVYGPSSTVLRLSNLYGPGDQGRVVPIFFAHALSGRPLRIYGSDKILDLIWIGDVVDVLIQAGFGSMEISEPVNVGSGSAVGLGDLALKIKEITHSPSAIENCPARELEVDRFQADLCRANQYFDLAVQTNPLNHLVEMIERREGIGDIG